MNVHSLWALVEQNVEDIVPLVMLLEDNLLEKMENVKSVPILVESQLIEKNVQLYNAQEMISFQ